MSLNTLGIFRSVINGFKRVHACGHLWKGSLISHRRVYLCIWLPNILISIIYPYSVNVFLLWYWCDIFGFSDVFRFALRYFALLSLSVLLYIVLTSEDFSLVSFVSNLNYILFVLTQTSFLPTGFPLRRNNSEPETKTRWQAEGGVCLDLSGETDIVRIQPRTVLWSAGSAQNGASVSGV